MNEPVITVIGNLAGDPEMRAVGQASVANFTVMSTPRKKDGDQWVDGEALTLRCSVWREPADHVMESLRKGDRIIVTGRLTSRSWEKDGQKRTAFELEVDEVGPSLRFGVTQFRKSGGGSRPAGSQRASRPSGTVPSDPWAAKSEDPWAATS
jgi:single-strand DNA-binding protein